VVAVLLAAAVATLGIAKEQQARAWGPDGGDGGCGYGCRGGYYHNFWFHHFWGGCCGWSPQNSPCCGGNDVQPNDQGYQQPTYQSQEQSQGASINVINSPGAYVSTNQYSDQQQSSLRHIVQGLCSLTGVNCGNNGPYNEEMGTLP
jgi:hypothetical protein